MKSLGGVLLVALVCDPVVGQPFPSRVDLGQVSVEDALVFEAAEVGMRSGHAVAGIGDFNDDGFDDVAISTPGASNHGEGSGSVYVVFGFANANIESVDLAALDGTNGFRIDGRAANDELGLWQGVAGAGDVNGDGFDDLFLGANEHDANGFDTGQIYVLFGRTGAPPVLDLDVLDGTNGAAINGIDPGDKAGISISVGGDVNGDGLDDFVIGASSADTTELSAGEAYIGFGRTVWPATLELANLNGVTGFVLQGDETSESTGWSVSMAGDVNGDGYHDVLVGAPYADPNGISSGEAYLIFGGQEWPQVLDVAELDGLAGTVIRGIDFPDLAGRSVRRAGDVNGDGYDDVVIGAPSNNRFGSNTGEAYIVYGGEVWSGGVELSELDASTGVVFWGIEGHQVGYTVSDAGDFNGDGLADVVLSGTWADSKGRKTGEAYVGFGGEELSGTILLEELAAPAGLVVEGADEGWETSSSVASAGDFNGDGVDDLLVSSSGFDDGTGVTHLLFGRYETGITLGATGGACPGPIRVRSDGHSPFSEIEIYRGSARGSSTVLSGPCAGARLDLEDAERLSSATANELGQVMLDVEVGSPLVCGTHLQVIALESCEESNVTRVPGN